MLIFFQRILNLCFTLCTLENPETTLTTALKNTNNQSLLHGQADPDKASSLCQEQQEQELEEKHQQDDEQNEQQQEQDEQQSSLQVCTTA